MQNPVSTAHTMRALQNHLQQHVGLTVYRYDGAVEVAVEECVVMLQDEAANLGACIVLGRAPEEVTERDAAAQGRYRALRVTITPVVVRTALEGLSVQQQFERLDDLGDAVEAALSVDREGYASLLQAMGANLTLLVGREPIGLPEDDFFASPITYEIRRSRR